MLIGIFDFSNNELFVMIFFYITIYSLTLLVLLTTFDIYTTKFVTFNDFKYITSFLIKILIISALLSMGGVPPFIGFFTKLLLLTILLNSYNIINLFIFLLILLFALYFYFKNVRFLLIPVNNLNITLTYLYINSYVYNMLYILLVFLFFLFFGFFYLNDIFILIT